MSPRPEMVALAELAQSIWGPCWQTPLAQHIGVSGRTVRRWARGAGGPDATHLVKASERGKEHAWVTRQAAATVLKLSRTKQD